LGAELEIVPPQLHWVFWGVLY